jgi:predicted RNase H-like HicB family nuclease
LPFVVKGSLLLRPDDPSIAVGSAAAAAVRPASRLTNPTYNRGMRELSVVVERDREGFYVGSIPSLPGCHSQAKSLDELMERIREAAELCLEVEGADHTELEFVGLQRLTLV